MPSMHIDVGWVVTTQGIARWEDKFLEKKNTVKKTPQIEEIHSRLFLYNGTQAP